jgi:hypothetical protein
MTYRTDSDREGRWRLYTEPIDLPPGTTTIRTRAVRIGYADSDELVARFTVA